MYVKHFFTEKTGFFEAEYAKSNILTQKVILFQLHITCDLVILLFT